MAGVYYWRGHAIWFRSRFAEPGSPRSGCAQNLPSGNFRGVGQLSAPNISGQIEAPLGFLPERAGRLLDTHRQAVDRDGERRDRDAVPI